MKKQSLSKCTQNKQKSNSKKLFEHHTVEGTPFVILEQDRNFKILIGQQLASNTIFDSKEKAEEYINEKPWELLLTVMVCVKQN